MSWSLGEIRALSVKAARGAGMDWGIAEEAGFAVEWLEKHCLQGTRALAQYLSKVSTQDSFKPKHCPIRLGCLISDMGDWTSQKDMSIYEPLLMVPFLANIVTTKAVLLRWNENRVFIHKDGVATDGLGTLIAASGAGHHIIELMQSEPEQDSLELKTRVLEDAKPHIIILNTLAHKTYAPATEASRLAGAGAGLNDND